MNFLLTMLICSSTVQGITCLPPHTFDISYKDGYECMLDGYTKAYDKIVELGRDDVNKYNIYIKFGCNEGQSNKTAISSIVIK